MVAALRNEVVTRGDAFLTRHGGDGLRDEDLRAELDEMGSLLEAIDRWLESSERVVNKLGLPYAHVKNGIDLRRRVSSVREHVDQMMAARDMAVAALQSEAGISSSVAGPLKRWITASIDSVRRCLALVEELDPEQLEQTVRDYYDAVFERLDEPQYASCIEVRDDVDPSDVVGTQDVASFLAGLAQD